MTIKSNRRDFLKGLAKGTGMLAAAPVLGTSLSGLAHASSGQAKLKVVFAVIPDGFGVDSWGGYNNGLWYPSASGSDTSNFELNVMSQELAAYRKQSLFLSGMITSHGNGGHNGWKYVLRDFAGQQSSIDNILGQALPGTNPTLKRIYAGPHATVGAAWNISYDGSSMIRPEISPYALYDQVFKGVTGSSNTQQTADTTSHLFDPVTQQLMSFRQRLSSAERGKLDTHLDALEQLQTDLAKAQQVQSGSCSPTSHQPAANMAITSADYRTEVTDAHSDVIAGGLSCGASRVATLQIGRSADPVVIKSVSASRNPHDCAHRYGSVEEWRGSRLWYAKRVKYLLDQLASLPDPDVAGDSLLEHTIVVFTSEMADGAPEHMENVPITMIGGGSGKLNTGTNGRYYDISGFGDRSHWRLGKVVDTQRIWATLARAAGTDVPYSGNTDTVPGIFY